MITTFFLTIFYGLTNLLVSFLPSGHLPSEIETAFSYFMSLLNLFSYVVPVDTLLQAALIILAFDGVLMLWYFVNWIIRKIPGMK